MPPIKEDGQGQIAYTEPSKVFAETGVAFDTDFGIADKVNQVKQIQFDVNCLTPGPGIATLQVDIAGDQIINLSSLGAKSNSFAIIQPDHGTSPTALVYNDVLTETSSDNSIVITGNSGTNTLNFQASAAIQSGSTAANNATSVNIANTIVKRDGSGNFNAGTITANLIGSSSSFTGSLAGDVTGTQSATTVALVGGSTAANVHNAELLANAATNSNTASTIVKRDSSGNFSAGTITANLNGNATTATSATTAGTSTNFSGSLSGDVTGTQSATVVALVGGSSAANVHSAELLANAATSSNTASTIVRRDASGNFSAGTISATQENISNFIQFTNTTAPSTPSSTLSDLYVDSSNGFSRLRFIDSTGLVMTVGRDSFNLVYNNSGSTIAKGQAVYFTGVNGGIGTIALAEANSSATSPAYGLTAESIANNSYGRVQFTGVVSGIDTSAFTSGQIVYLSATIAGALTGTKPLSPNAAQTMAVILTASVSGSLTLTVRDAQSIQNNNVDGGSAGTSYLSSQLISGGTA